MTTTAFKPSMGQIERARVSIQNAWTRGCREKRRREAYARQDWLAEILRDRVSPVAGSEHREFETCKLRNVRTQDE
jgi:hypothetical protein